MRIPQAEFDIHFQYSQKGVMEKSKEEVSGGAVPAKKPRMIWVDQVYSRYRDFGNYCTRYVVC